MNFKSKIVQKSCQDAGNGSPVLNFELWLNLLTWQLNVVHIPKISPQGCRSFETWHLWQSCIYRWARLHNVQNAFLTAQQCTCKHCTRFRLFKAKILEMFVCTALILIISSNVTNFAAKMCTWKHCVYMSLISGYASLSWHVSLALGIHQYMTSNSQNFAQTCAYINMK